MIINSNRIVSSATNYRGLVVNIIRGHENDYEGRLGHATLWLYLHIG